VSDRLLMMMIHEDGEDAYQIHVGSKVLIQTGIKKKVNGIFR
jgi:hypothetical protein